MLLSAREMGLGDDHAGIVDLPEDAPVGVPYAQWAGLDDPVIDVSVTPNRGDCFSRARHRARPGRRRHRHAEAVAAGARSRRRSTAARAGRSTFPRRVPWILGRTIRGVQNGPSPQWLQDRLTSIGLRPINALVDVTNFFTIDLGRPLHVFDVAKLTGDVLTLRRGARRDVPRAERQGLHRRRRGLRHRRRRRRAVDGRRDGRRGDRLRRNHHHACSSNARCSIRCASR